MYSLILVTCQAKAKAAPQPKAAAPEPKAAAVAAPEAAGPEAAEPKAAAAPLPGAAAPKVKAAAVPKPMAVVADRPVPRNLRDSINTWTNVRCEQCGIAVAGQMKLDPGPGDRDPKTWFVRVLDEDGKWPNQGRFRKRSVCKIVGESDEWPLSWIAKHKKCCGPERHHI